MNEDDFIYSDPDAPDGWVKPWDKWWNPHPPPPPDWDEEGDEDEEAADE